MSATSRTDWFWSDWLGDLAVRRLTLAERGLWIDLIAFAALANPTGYVCDDHGRPLTLEEIARVSNAGSPDEVAKLVSGILGKGACSRDRSGRLFNRRLVREAELRAKRSFAGKKGALQTNRRYWDKSLNFNWNDRVPRQAGRQTTPQNPRAPPHPLSKENKNPRTSAVQRTARATPADPPLEQNKPAGSLATARDDGALARPPGAENVAKKPPHEVTRAELETIYAARRNGDKP